MQLGHVVDDLYLHTRPVVHTSMKSTASTVKWAQSIGVATMANKNVLFVTLVGRTKLIEASFHQI